MVPTVAQISIHTLLAESDAAVKQPQYILRISIHTLLAESDESHGGDRKPQRISIHTLLAESDSKISQNTNIVLEHLAQILHIYNSLFFILT